MKEAYKTALQEGVRGILKNSKFIWIFWATNFIFSIVLTLPVFYILNENLKRSALSDLLRFDFNMIWLLQFFEEYKTNIGVVSYMIYGVIGVYILIQVFYLGGLISVMHLPNKNHHVDFFYGCVKYAARFVKILFISLFFYALAFKFNDYMGDFIIWLFKDSENRLTEFIIRALRYSILIFLIGVVSLISDYAKISIAVKDSSQGVIKEIYNSILFIKSNFSLVFSVFITIASIGAFGAVIYNLATNFIPRTEYLFLLLSFFLQQLLIIFRLYVRLFFYSSQVYLYKDATAPVIETGTIEIRQGV